jgi:hypothetical protein
MTTVTKNSTPSVTGFGRILRVGLNTTILASAINALLFLSASSVTFPATALTPQGTPVTLAPVVMMTLFGGIAATIGYLILSKLLAQKTAKIVMLAGSALVLIGMFFNPFGIENAPVAQIVVLEIMHLVAALPAWRLTR